MIEDKYVKGIIVESETSSPDGLGGTVKTWKTYLTVDGKIFDQSLRNIQISHDGAAYTTHYLLCDAKNPNGTKRVITTQNRIRFNSDVYNISRIIELSDSTEDVFKLKIELYKVS